MTSYKIMVVWFLIVLTIAGTAQGLDCDTYTPNNLLPRTCVDLLCLGQTTDGVYDIYPTGQSYLSIEVFCDQTTDGGGWTVFQRRMDGTENFYRNWYNYKLGFGEVDREFWLGNDKIVTVLKAHPNNELRVDMEAVDNGKAYAKYSKFSIGDEDTGYVLGVSGYSGSAGDSLTKHGKGQKFSTLDRDNDKWPRSCAQKYKGAWWYKNCHHSNLNGFYHNGNHKSYADGVNWESFKGYRNSLKTTEMKLRGRN